MSERERRRSYRVGKTGVMAGCAVALLALLGVQSAAAATIETLQQRRGAAHQEP